MLTKAGGALSVRLTRELPGTSRGRDRCWQQVFHGHGLHILVQSNDRTLLDALALDTVPGLSASDGGSPDLKYTVRVASSRSGPQCDVYLGTHRIAEGIQAGQAPRFVQSHVEWAMAGAARAEVFVHAGAIAWNGRLILLPGRSYSGKSTLVREFLNRGASYYSDEFAVVDFSGRVHAYPRPLNLRGVDGIPDGRWAGGEDVESGHHRRRDVECERASHKRAWKTGVYPMRPELVVFAHYQPSRSWQASRLTPGGTVLELMAHTVAARSRAKFALHCLKEIAQRVTAYRAVRGEAGVAAGHILRLLAGVPMPAANQ